MCAMMVPCAFLPHPPFKQSFYWHLITTNFCVLLSFFSLLSFYVITIIYFPSFGFVFVGLISLILFFLFYHFHYFWLRFKFYLQKCMCVCVLVCLCNDFQHCFGIKFYMDVHCLFKYIYRLYIYIVSIVFV